MTEIIRLDEDDAARLYRAMHDQVSGEAPCGAPLRTVRFMRRGSGLIWKVNEHEWSLDVGVVDGTVGVPMSAQAKALIAALAHRREVEADAGDIAEAWAEVQRFYPVELAAGMPRSKERKQLLRDVMVTAVCGGVGYWAMADNLVHDHERNEYVSYVLICEDETGDVPDRVGECVLSTEEQPVPRCLGHLVTPDVVEKGLGLVAATSLNGEIKRSILLGLAENDGGEIDSIGADVIVQLGVFGEVVYG